MTGPLPTVRVGDQALIMAFFARITPPLRTWPCYYTGCGFCASGRTWDRRDLSAQVEDHVRLAHYGEGRYE